MNEVEIIKRLLKIKKAGKEEGDLPSSIKEPDLDALIVVLMDKIDKAYQTSILPDKLHHDSWKEMNEWLIKLRRKYLI